MTAREQYAPGPASGAQVRKDGEKWTLILVRELRHAGNSLAGAHRPGASARVGALRRRWEPGDGWTHGEAHDGGSAHAACIEGGTRVVDRRGAARFASGKASQEVPLNWNIWIRQIHRWVSIAFTVTVIANFIALAQGSGMPPPWVTYSPLLGIGAHLEKNRRTRGLARGNPQQNAQAHQGSRPGRRRGVEVDGHSGLGRTTASSALANPTRVS